jgi:hypothetical protein
MSSKASGSLQSEGAEALDLMEQALELLDRCDAHDMGAHLDLAICRLRDAIASEEASRGGVLE